MNKIKTFLLNSETLTNGEFIFKFFLISNLPKAILMVILFFFLFLAKSNNEDIGNINDILPVQGVIKDVFAGGIVSIIAVTFAVVIGPLIETFAYQALPIWLLSRFTKRMWILVLISSLIFALGHSVDKGLFAFYLGIILAWSYIIKSRVSQWQGIWVTFIIHSLTNLLAIFLQFLLKFVLG